MQEMLFLFPLCTGTLAFFLPSRVGRGLLAVTAVGHFVLCLAAVGGLMKSSLTGYFLLGPSGTLVLLLTALIFLCVACYAMSYMKATEMDQQPLFVGCLLLFLGTMNMVCLADHPIVLWIAIEATTLASAPLIFLHRSKEALEATWKYVLICSVGIALALLGCFFITLAADLAEVGGPLSFSRLNEVAPRLDPLWLKAGFIFIVIGFGTKVGLAPMHTWLPDSHSEAPGPASALLSGALLNCAFLGIYKMHTIMYLAGLGDFSGNILVVLGLCSIFVAGVFIVRQPDYKRLLAYSSIENMGVIAFGVGIGGFALYGAMLHLLHHSLLKSSLFLSAGDIHLQYASKLASSIGGLARRLPHTFVPFFAGFIGICGLPPFGLFLSELVIVFAAFHAGKVVVALLFLAGLLLVVAGAAQVIIEMCFGPEQEFHREQRSSLWRVIPCSVLLALSLGLTLWMPWALQQLIIDAIALLGGRIHG